jgi:hypothetical protein
MPAYHSVFLRGENVKIKPPEFLRQYLAPDWRWHNPLDSDNLKFAGGVFAVVDIGYFHGGEVMYELQGIRGFWHEDSVEDYMLSDVMWEGYPKPADYFVIDAIEHEGHRYLRVSTREGLECLRKLADDTADSEAEDMRAVAELRHFRGFLERYDFWAPFQAPIQKWPEEDE